MTRTRCSVEFKTKVALDAIQDDLTLAELAAKHGAAWKRQAVEGVVGTFFGVSDVTRAGIKTKVYNQYE